MAEVQANDSGKGGKKVKQKKVTLRVDFTPMVDMNMLLITFFMFCTSLSKPQTMEIGMPDKSTDETTLTKVRPELAVTIVLAKDSKVFYYEGEPDYKDYTSLKETDYSPEGLRKLLLRRNANIISRVDVLKQKKKNGELTEDQFKNEVAEVKKAKDAIVVVIKPMDDSSYKNMVDALDEMLICNVGKYAIVDFSPVEDFLLKNLETKGNAAETI